MTRTKKGLVYSALLFAALLLQACSLFSPAQPTPTFEPSPSALPFPTHTHTPGSVYPPPLPPAVADPTANPYPIDPGAVPAQPYPAPENGSSAGSQTTPTGSAGSSSQAYPLPATAVPPPSSSYPLPQASQTPSLGGGYPGPGVTPTVPGSAPTPAGAAVSPTSPAAAVFTPTSSFGTSAATPTGIPGTAAATPTERPVSTAMPPPRTSLMTVSIWHSWNETERQTLDDVVGAFQEVYPDIYFDLLYVPFDQLRQRYEMAAYSGSGPNLVFGPAEWGPSFYEKGLVTDLSEIATREFLDTIYPAALDQVQYQNALIGLPHTVRSGIVLYRNQALIVSAPATFEELVSLSKAAARPGVVGAYLDRSFFYSAAHLYGLGGRLMDSAGNPSFNSAAGREWLDLLASFREAGPVDFNTNRDLEYFKSGRAGFLIDSITNRQVLAEALGENLVIDPWPRYQSGSLSGFIRTDNIYLNANLNQDQRYNPLLFMGFMLAPEVQSVLARAGHIPVVPATEVDDPLLRQAAFAFEGAAGYPILPAASVYWEPLNQAMQSFFARHASASAALQQAHELVVSAISNLRSQ